MFGLSLGHILILGIIVLLFGHRRLPELGSALGKGVSAFKRGLEGKDHDGEISDQSQQHAPNQRNDDYPPKA